MSLPICRDLPPPGTGPWKATASVPFSGAWAAKQLADKGVAASIIFPNPRLGPCPGPSTEQEQQEQQEQLELQRGRFVSAMHSDHDLPGLMRSARRQAQSSRRVHDRRRGLPEDELAVLRRNQASQEAEWRRILRVQQGRSASSSSSSSSWAETRLPAGLKPQDEFGRRYHAHGPGNVRPENLPVEVPPQVSPWKKAPSEASAGSRLTDLEEPLESIPGGLLRLSQLLRCDGVRP